MRWSIKIEGDFHCGCQFLSASLDKRSSKTRHGGGTRPFAAVRVQTGDYPILSL